MLSAGLVLGIGSAVTYAAWVDDEYAQSTFTASIFNTQSSVDGSLTWADNNVSPGATMTFNGAGMSPNAVRYAPLAIRSTTGSIAGTAVLSGASINNLPMAAVMEYRVVLYTGTCSSASFTTGTPTFVVGTSTTPSSLTTPGTTAIPIAANQASATQLCFEVKMQNIVPNSLQGASLTAIWHLTATSNS